MKSDDVVSLVGDIIPAFPYRFKDVISKAKEDGLEFYVCLIFCVMTYCRDPRCCEKTSGH